MKAQRESWHGVDYMYHGRIDFEDFFHRYTETLKGVDDSVGAVLDFLDENKLAEDTLVIYMGDNGFSFGEHGLIDKRHFYEESAKVPLLVRWPTRLEAALHKCLNSKHRHRSNNPGRGRPASTNAYARECRLSRY